MQKFGHYFEVELERLAPLSFPCWGHRKRPGYFCDYAILAAQLAKLDLRVLSARGFCYKPGTGTGPSPGRSHPLSASWLFSGFQVCSIPFSSARPQFTPGVIWGWNCPCSSRGAVRCSFAKAVDGNITLNFIALRGGYEHSHRGVGAGRTLALELDAET